jgi:hypothetical protein
MKKYYWIYVGALIGLSTVIMAYWMINFLVVGGKLNLFSAVGVIVIYAVVVYAFSLVYEKLKK